MSNEMQIANAEEKRLKLISKRVNVTSDNKEAGIIARAKLRFLKYKKYDFDSVEEKVNHTYSKLKYNPVAAFFRGFFSFSRKYRFMTGFLGYFTVIASAVQTGAVFIFSSAFMIVSLPFSLLTYILIALPRKIRIIKACDRLIRSGKNISIVTADGVTYDELCKGYAKQLISHTAEKGICLVVSSKASSFFAFKKASDDVYICSHRFVTQLKKRMDKKEFLWFIEI